MKFPNHSSQLGLHTHPSILYFHSFPLVGHYFPHFIKSNLNHFYAFQQPPLPPAKMKFTISATLFAFLAVASGIVIEDRQAGANANRPVPDGPCCTPNT